MCYLTALGVLMGAAPGEVGFWGLTPVLLALHTIDASIVGLSRSVCAGFQSGEVWELQDQMKFDLNSSCQSLKVLWP